MAVLLWSTIIISAALLAHLLLWRTRLPRRQTKAILYIFLSAIILGLFVLFKYNQPLSMFGLPTPDNLSEYLHILIFLVSLTAGYIILYPGFEVDVPSLIIVNTIAKAGSEGIEKAKLYETVNDDILIIPRLQDLLLDKMAYIDNGRYRLTSKGILIITIILFFRKLQRLGKKGG